MEIQHFSMTARLDYTPESMDRFVDLCEQAIMDMTPNRQARFLLKTAVDELTLNAIEHGYRKTSGLITVSIDHCGDAMRLELSDHGRGIDPSQIQWDRVAMSEEDLRSRGWAFSILHKLSQNLYISQNDPNGARISLLIPLWETVDEDASSVQT